MGAPSVITSAALLKHWQGHRGLTRRVIEAFPEKELLDFSIGGMRPFSQLALELVMLSGGGLRGVVTGNWDHTPPKVADRTELLGLWDSTTGEIDALWGQLPEGRFQEVVSAFGQWEGRVYEHILYWIDNEVHHRGQGYVYLRALGIAPPPFWDRS